MKTKNELRALLEDWMLKQAEYYAASPADAQAAKDAYMLAKRTYSDACMNYVAWMLADDDQNPAGKL